MRIATWNMHARWGDAHRSFLEAVEADVWLLTEVHPSVELEGFHSHRTTGVMGRGQHWAGVYSRQPLMGVPQVHVATAAAVVGEVTFCSSILPWRGLASSRTWPGTTHAERTGKALERLRGRLLTKAMVWGGDWNHALFGPESAGDKAGRAHIYRALSRLKMNVPTAHLPHRKAGRLSIDHIAVPADWDVSCAKRIPGDELSDHDCYVVELADH